MVASLAEIGPNGSVKIDLPGFAGGVSDLKTAMNNPADIPVMLHELMKIGGSMTIAIFAVWAVMVLVANKATNIREKKIQIITT